MSVAKSFTVLALFGICLILFAASPARGQATADDPVIVCDHDWPPFYFAGAEDKPKGVGRELLELCLPEEHGPYKHVFFPVERMFQNIERGVADITVFSYKHSREEFSLYGQEPLFNLGYRPVVRADSDIAIAGVADFDTLKIGHLHGLRYSKEFSEYLEERKKADMVVTVFDTESLFRMLEKGIIDVFVEVQESVAWYAHQNDIADQIKILDFDIQTKDYYAVVSRKSERIKNPAELLDKTDACLRKAKQDGRYRSVLSWYGMGDLAR